MGELFEDFLHVGMRNAWCEEYKNTYHGQRVKVAGGCCTVVQVITSKELLTASNMLLLQNLDEE